MKSKTKKGLLIFTVCFAAAFILALLPHCSKGFEQGYEQGFEREFVTSCSGGELPESACQCVYTELRKKYSMVEMTQWSITGFPEDFADEAALACNLEPQ